jgi:hypothetical protein
MLDLSWQCNATNTNLRHDSLVLYPTTLCVDVAFQEGMEVPQNHRHTCRLAEKH